MKVLSLFDGISCGRVALGRAGVKVDKYYASEVERKVIDVTMYHFPDTVQLGDVTALTTERLEELGEIDLLIGGSPCQGFSLAGNRLNFEDERSRLLFEYVRVLKTVKSRFFLLENVNMMRDVVHAISEELGVKPRLIDSELFSAQGRKRLYWTNIDVPELPAHNDLGVEDILEENPRSRWTPTIERQKDVLLGEVARGRANGDGDVFELLDEEGRCFSKKQIVNLGNFKWKGLEFVRPALSVKKVNNRQRGPRFRLSTNKAYTVTTHDSDCHGIVTERGLREFSFVELERLQTLPDNYTEKAIGDLGGYAPRRHAIGNAWTVEVIRHIFSGLPDEYKTRICARSI